MKDHRITSKGFQNVTTFIKRLVQGYIRAIHVPFLGSSEAWEQADIIIVLGTTSPSVEERLDLALSTASKLPPVPLILSGGGRQFIIEADFMHEYLCKKRNILSPPNISNWRESLSEFRR